MFFFLYLNEFHFQMWKIGKRPLCVTIARCRAPGVKAFLRISAHMLILQNIVGFCKILFYMIVFGTRHAGKKNIDNAEHGDS